MCSFFVCFADGKIVTHPDNKVVAYAALIAASLSLGFWAGIKATPRSENPSASPTKPAVSSHPSSPKQNSAAEMDGDESEDGSDSESEAADGDIGALTVGSNEDCKMVRCRLSYEGWVYTLFIRRYAIGSCCADRFGHDFRENRSSVRVVA